MTAENDPPKLVLDTYDVESTSFKRRFGDRIEALNAAMLLARIPGEGRVVVYHNCLGACTIIASYEAH